MKADALIKEMQEYRAFLVGTDMIRGKPVSYTYVVIAGHVTPAPRVSKKMVEQLFKEGKIKKAVGLDYEGHTDIYALNTDLYPYDPLPYYYNMPADHKPRYSGKIEPA